MKVSELIDAKSGERKYLNAEERKAFFEATTFMDNDIKFYGRMIYYTGARLSEVLAATPDFIDYKEGVVIINTLKQSPDRPYPRPVELPAAVWIARRWPDRRPRRPLARIPGPVGARRRSYRRRYGRAFR